MASNRLLLQRKYGKRRYKRLFDIVGEGEVTEKEYFQKVEYLLNTIIKFRCSSARDGRSADSMDNCISGFKSDSGFRKGDEVWIVIDLDCKTRADLNDYLNIARKHKCGLAISNPAFEIWLIFHFADASNVINVDNCIDRLGQYVNGYSDRNKHLSKMQITSENIEHAIGRARSRDEHRANETSYYLIENCGSSVYRLMENVMAASRAYGG